jgi:hypothetical protein
MVEHRWASSTVDEVARAALPAPTAALTVSVFDDLRVVSLRHLPGGAAAIEAALATHGLMPLPQPGACRGNDPWLLWTGPTECLLLSSQGGLVDGVLQALAPGRETLAFAVDRSAGCQVFDLLGSGVADLLPRLVDASAIPQRTGQGHRARWMDIGALLVRVEPDRVLLVIDRMHGVYAAQWIRHALVPPDSQRLRPP